MRAILALLSLIMTALIMSACSEWTALSYAGIVMTMMTFND